MKLRFFAEEKMTPWFPANIKPAHEGVYYVRHAINGLTSEGWAYWDSDKWRTKSDTIKEAVANCRYVSMQQKKMWRGLKERK